MHRITTDRPAIARGACALMAALALVACACARAATPSTLRVCADPNNLPFSDRAGAGFENAIVRLIANDLDARVEYTWWAQRRGYARHTLKENHCDLWPGVATRAAHIDTTEPYYRSSYMFVTRTADGLDLHSFDDSRLRRLRIGVQMIGNDANNTPPAHALARRGIIDNVRGYMIYGNYAEPEPEAAIVRAVESGDVDVAIAWGPVAGYFSQRSSVPLTLSPVPPDDGRDWPMAFDISMGVRKNDAVFKRKIEAALAREHEAIAAILDRYSIPRVGDPH